MAELLPLLGDVDVVRTEGPGHARTLAREAVWAGRELLLSLGGDGTHGEVVAGIVRDRPAPGSITLGVLPAGTGGDFRRMVHGSRALLDHARLLSTAVPHEIDVGVLKHRSLDGETVERTFLNEASVGLGGLVCSIVNHSGKRLRAASYYVATLRAVTRYRSIPVRVAIDGVDVGDFDVNTAMISNGRYAGGGMYLAPRARLADGMLDLTLIEHASAWNVLGITPRLYDGTIEASPLVHTFRGFTVAIRALGDGDLLVEADGDVVGGLPVEASVLPGGIRMLGVREDVL